MGSMYRQFERSRTHEAESVVGRIKRRKREEIEAHHRAASRCEIGSVVVKRTAQGVGILVAGAIAVGGFNAIQSCNGTLHEGRNGENARPEAQRIMGDQHAGIDDVFKPAEPPRDIPSVSRIESPASI